MTALTAALAPPASSDPAASVALPDPAERGTVSIADKVVQRVAGYAVTQVGDAVAAPRRVLGVNIGQARPQDTAHVEAHVHGATATVEATIAVRWPRPVRQVATQVRQRIRDDVADITGITIDHIDLDVVSLSVPTPAKARVQ